MKIAPLVFDIETRVNETKRMLIISCDFIQGALKLDGETDKRRII